MTGAAGSRDTSEDADTYRDRVLVLHVQVVVIVEEVSGIFAVVLVRHGGRTPWQYGRFSVVFDNRGAKLLEKLGVVYGCGLQVQIATSGQNRRDAAACAAWSCM